MMRHVKVEEAKTHLSSLLAAVKAGEAFVFAAALRRLPLSLELRARVLSCR